MLRLTPAGSGEPAGGTDDLAANYSLTPAINHPDLPESVGPAHRSAMYDNLGWGH